MIQRNTTRKELHKEETSIEGGVLNSVDKFSLFTDSKIYT